MTRESPHVSRPAGCPDPALIAAHADRRLTGAEAARMDEHVAGCPDCYDVFAATVQFGLAEPEAETEGVERTEARAVGTVARLRPWTFARPVGLAAAAVLLIALGLWLYRAHSPRPSAPLVAELADAMGARRFIEPRLTGGFRHGRLVTLRSGETPQGLDAQPATVLAAVARIRERAEGDTSPETLGALGVTYLVSGDAAAAVKALESASAQKPDDAGLLSDLAAAYLVRAKNADEPADIPKALEAAERAIVLPEPPPEAYFNRALALESLHLGDAARKAWQDYLDRDASSPWADEARQHLDALSQVRRSSVEEDKARVRAAIEAGPAAIDRLAEDSPSIVRAYFEDDLLPAWADAYVVGHPDAHAHGDRVHLVAGALSRATGDVMPAAAARALLIPGAAASPDRLRAQAVGYRALQEAKGLYDRQEPSCSAFRGASRDLEVGGSPYATWAGLQTVSACLLFPLQPEAAIAELRRLESVAEPLRYTDLLGRIRWVQGLVDIYRGDLARSLERYRSALASFQLARDAENEAVILGLLADDLRHLGETRGAWRERQQGLASLGQIRSHRGRYRMLGEATAALLQDRQPRSALHVGNELVASAVAWSRAAAIDEALVRRAEIHHALGADDLASADLVEARRWIARIGDRALAARQGADADAADGGILLDRSPGLAAGPLTQSLAYFRTTAPVRVPALHLLLARAQTAQGLDDAAEAELSAGIEAMERQRTSLRDPSLQVSFFDQASGLFDDMVRLQVSRRHAPDAALAFVERGHARQLIDSLAGADVRALDIEALREGLPDGLALVYYVPLEDRLFGWLLSRKGSHFIERSLPAAELSRLVAAHLAAITGRASPGVVRQTASRLHRELVLPFIPFLASQRALVIVPHGVLQTVPFASLWNPRTSRYLVEDYLLEVTPSGTVFAKASQTLSASHPSAPRALVVGNPRVDRQVWGPLANLPGAEAEAGDIARLYGMADLLTGPEATKAAFLDAARASEVVHFAGHAASSTASPSAAHLLFAPDPRRRDTGGLYLQDLGYQGLPHTRVVVLAACRTGAGAISGVEGALSIGRPFLAAGVPAVISSLWDIDDSLSREFFVRFHRALLAEGDPVVALRKSQIALLRGGDATLAHPASWAAFICMGGFDPHSLSKGASS